MSDVTVTNDDELTLNDNLGSPDFGDLIDDDSAEITAADLTASEPKAQSGLKVGELITMVVGLSFGFVARRKGEHWKLQPDEAQELATATDAVVDEHFPDLECSPAFMLCAVGAGIAAPRMLIDAQNEMEEQDNDAKNNSQKTVQAVSATEHQA